MSGDPGGATTPAITILEKDLRFDTYTWGLRDFRVVMTHIPSGTVLNRGSSEVGSQLQAKVELLKELQDRLRAACCADDNHEFTCPKRDEPEVDALAEILRAAHDAYSRASWDDWMYKAMAGAAIRAGYSL